MANELPVIPDYDIEATLGRGGMANVYKARHLRLNRLVALKVMHDELATRDSQFSKRFLREAQISADLTHPHIVHVYDVNKHENMHYIAMEYVGGGDLHDRLRSYISHEDLLTIIEQIVSALDFAHTKGYVHRDIKPANILFRENGEVLVSDFGIAKALKSNTHMTEFGSVLGTPTYMSPEQAGGKEVDGRSDLYSVAVMVYQILTGTPPYLGNTSLTIAIKHVNDPIPKLPESLQAVQPFIDKGMAKSPEDRFANGEELMTLLRECIALLEPEDVKTTQAMVLSNLKEYAKTEAANWSSDINEVDTDKTLKSNVHPAGEKTGPSITIQLPAKMWPGLLVLTVLVVGSLGVYLLLPKDILPEQKARIELLLGEADEDIQAGRLVSPDNNNAWEKIQQALLIAPDYPATLQAADELVMVLLKQSEESIAGKNWKEARKYLLQALEIDPENEQATQQLSMVDEVQEKDLQKREQLLQTARDAAKEGQWGLAIETYTELQNISPLDTTVESEIAGYGRDFVKQGKQQTEKQQFDAAIDSFNQARKFLPLGNQSDLKAEINTAETINRQKYNTYKLNKRLDSLFQQATETDDPDKKLDLYVKILKLSPGNKLAFQAIENNIRALFVEAHTEITKGDIDNAEDLMDTIERSGQVVSLTDDQRRQLKSLRRDMKVANSEQASINKLFDRFRRYMEASRLRSAQKIYRRIITLTTSDSRLPDARKQLAAEHLILAEKDARNQDWEDALENVEQGLEFVPESPELKALRTRILEHIPEKKKKKFGIF